MATVLDETGKSRKCDFRVFVIGYEEVHLSRVSGITTPIFMIEDQIEVRRVPGDNGNKRICRRSGAVPCCAGVDAFQRLGAGYSRTLVHSA